jgi:hypothetical protein
MKKLLEAIVKTLHKAYLSVKQGLLLRRRRLVRHKHDPTNPRAFYEWLRDRNPPTEGLKMIRRKLLG